MGWRRSLRRHDKKLLIEEFEKAGNPGKKLSRSKLTKLRRAVLARMVKSLRCKKTVVIYTQDEKRVLPEDSEVYDWTDDYECYCADDYVCRGCEKRGDVRRFWNETTVEITNGGWVFLRVWCGGNTRTKRQRGLQRFGVLGGEKRRTQGDFLVDGETGLTKSRVLNLD